VDDPSRVAYNDLLSDDEATTSGSAYRSHLLNTACRALWAKLIKTRPYTPRTNGKAECFTKTSL